MTQETRTLFIVAAEVLQARLPASAAAKPAAGSSKIAVTISAQTASPLAYVSRHVQLLALESTELLNWLCEHAVQKHATFLNPSINAAFTTRQIQRAAALSMTQCPAHMGSHCSCSSGDVPEDAF